MTDYDVDGDGQLQYKEFLGFVATLEAWIRRGQCSIFFILLHFTIILHYSHKNVLININEFWFG